MKKTKKTPMRSRAKTAYGLLTEVRRCILAQPKRYNQRDLLDGVGCGTVGCVAGWIAHLKLGADDDHWPSGGVMDSARRILGIRNHEADELFSGIAVGATPQTAAHARLGAEHIADFQKAHAAQLKAKRV